MRLNPHARPAFAVLVILARFATTSVDAQENEPVQTLSPFTVTGDRLVQPASYQDSNSGVTLSNFVLNGARIGIEDLSESIARYPAYAAFRKTPARSAHPTTQGVRLRNLGINSTSRTIVTLDGVPQNDPFGGWIYWLRYQPSSLSSIDIRPSSGSEAWGNYGTGGRISLHSAEPSSPRIHTKATLGTDGAQNASVSADAQLSSTASINFSALTARTDGFSTLRADQRGSVDVKSDSEVTAYQGLLRLNPTESWLFTLKADTYEEDRVNGTPLATNGTEATDISASALHLFADQTSGFKVIAYTQDRDFHNQFTAVADDRASERPALNQFEMPATAEGASVNFFGELGDGNPFTIGADTRTVDGEVNEQFRNLGSGFTRLRKAGGEQRYTGAFATLQLETAPATRIVANIRIDEVENEQGIRQEWNTETGAQIRNDAIPSSSENFFSNNITLYHDFTDNLRGMLRQTSGFRAPTLNELYRPFRVKNDIIESNSQLQTEEHFGLEAGLRFQSDESWSLSANIFQYRLDNMIANVVLSREPGFNPLCGFVPSGGSCGQRLNLSEATVEGLEINWDSQLADTLHARAQLVYAPTEIDSAPGLEALVGNEFPQSSAFKATLSFDWQPEDFYNLWTRIRYQDSAFEDLDNNRSLDNALSVDGGIQFAIDSYNALSLRVENLFDAQIETGISSAGLVSISSPRTAWLSWDFSR